MREERQGFEEVQDELQPRCIRFAGWVKPIKYLIRQGSRGALCICSDWDEGNFSILNEGARVGYL